ncbi:MAG: DNA polymerase III subunit gamma/tau [Candidatus Pacebacteria bacterium]|nr:DNA polymerase III subunit gamma/tau [Candidatus Paceibacterota bacterium]
MGYLVLARKYRPRTFAELVGQEHVVRTLSNSISEGRLAHAFLFVGPRGIGKTSTARILAKALNCPKGPKADFNPDDDICKEIEEGRSLDVLEIDGASNRGIESIKELRESVPYAPARGKFKIYIIDEVHMLTTEAFNALLKTLEEPPAHVKFIFATTEVQKLPATILSRCQRFDLRRIPDPLICSHLQKIAEAEKIKISDEALVLLARQAEGGLRDAESALEQLVSFAGKNITLDHVLEVFGLAGPIETRALASAILAGDSTSALAKVHEFRARHRDPIRVAQDLARHFRNLLLLQIAPTEAEAELGKLEKQTLLALGNPPDQTHLLSLLEQLLESEHHLRLSLAREVALEILVLRLCEMRERVSLETILKKLAVPGAETRAESAASRPAPSPTPKATSIPAPSPAKTPFAKNSSPSAPSSVSSNKETFLNDPAIQAALKGFGGRIIDS